MGESSKMETEQTGRQRPSWLLRCTLMLIGILLAEFAHRGFGLATGNGYSTWRSKEEVLGILARMDGEVDLGGPRAGRREKKAGSGFSLHPYTGWEIGWQFNELELNYQRSLRTDLNRKPTKDYHIWIMGGSVALGFGASGQGGVERLRERLSANERFADMRIVVSNYARAAFKQPQQVMLLAYLFALGMAPDAVINIDGFNEVAIGNQNQASDFHPAFPSAEQWAARVMERRIDVEDIDALMLLRAARQRSLNFAHTCFRFGVFHSSLLGSLAKARLQVLAADWERARKGFEARMLNDESEAPMRGPGLPHWMTANGDSEGNGAGDADSQTVKTKPKGKPVAGLGSQSPADAKRAVILTNWFESSLSMQALCAARSVEYMQCLQPTLHDKGSKPLTESELRTSAALDSWVDGVAFGYPRMRELGAQLRSRNVAFRDLSQVFHGVTEALYYDSCHFNSNGNELLADAIAEALIELIGSE